MIEYENLHSWNIDNFMYLVIIHINYLYFQINHIFSNFV